MWCLFLYHGLLHRNPEMEYMEKKMIGQKKLYLICWIMWENGKLLKHETYSVTLLLKTLWSNSLHLSKSLAMAVIGPKWSEIPLPAFSHLVLLSPSLLQCSHNHLFAARESLRELKSLGFYMFHCYLPNIL